MRPSNSSSSDESDCGSSSEVEVFADKSTPKSRPKRSVCARGNQGKQVCGVPEGTMLAVKRVRFDSPEIATRDLPVLREPSQPQGQDIFREFRRRYPKLQDHRSTPRVRRNPIDVLEEVAQQRKLKGERNRSSSEASTTKAQALRLSGIPPFEGNLSQFIDACVYLETLVKAKDTALHQSLWDDFVRFYATIWAPLFDAWKAKGRLNSQQVTESGDAYFTKLGLKHTPASMEPPVTMYCRDVFRPIYTGSILSPTTLPAVLCEHHGLTKKARLSLASYNALLGKEGYSSRRSRLWQ